MNITSVRPFSINIIENGNVASGPYKVYAISENEHQRNKMIMTYFLVQMPNERTCTWVDHEDAQIVDEKDISLGIGDIRHWQRIPEIDISGLGSKKEET